MVGRNLKTAFLSFTSRLCVELCKSRQCRSCCGKNQEEWHQSNNKWNGHKAKRGTDGKQACGCDEECNSAG